MNRLFMIGKAWMGSAAMAAGSGAWAKDRRYAEAAASAAVGL